MEWMHAPLGGALVSILLGLLLGLERQRAKGEHALFAGIRTFPLFTLCGFFGGLAAQKGVPLALPAVLVAVAGFGLASYLRAPERDAGVTTEMSGLLAALLGAVVAWGELVAAASCAVVVTLLLTSKAPLHRIAGKVSEDELLAIVKFGLVAVVLLPLLPDGPWPGRSAASSARRPPRCRSRRGRARRASRLRRWRWASCWPRRCSICGAR